MATTSSEGKEVLDNRVGNNLLYLLSQKKAMLYTRFKGHIDKMCRSSDKYFAYRLTRNLSALGYLGIGNDKKGRAVVSVFPPLLIELPFIAPQFMITGARSPELLDATKDIATIEIHDDLPDSIFISEDNKANLLERRLHGDTVAAFLKVPSHPWAWNILQFSGNVLEYRKSLKWNEGNRDNIKEIFDIQDMEFKPYNGERMEGEVLVRVSHYEKFSRCYLFNTENNKMAKINLDWGRFLALQETNRQVLRYDKRNLMLISTVFLPSLLERGLALCAGKIPKRYKGKQEYFFTKIAPKAAKLVADKLQQQLHEVRLSG